MSKNNYLNLIQERMNNMKIKKLLSGTLAVSMLSAFSVGMVIAEETKGTVTYIDADPEAIYVYSDVQYLDPAGVKESTTIIQNGVDITEDCTFTRVTDNLTGGGLSSTYRYCTKITPAEGTEFAVNVPSSISIKENSQIEDYSKSFAIQELLYDDFTDGVSNWTTASGNTIEQENGMMKMTMAASNSWNKYLAHTDYSSQTLWSDYTISFDYKLDSLTGFESMSMEYSTKDALSDVGGLGVGDYGFQERNGHIRIFNPNVSGGWTFRQYNDATNPVAGQTKHIKMSTSNNYMQSWSNGKKAIDYENSTAVTGAPVFCVSFNGGTIYFDNFRVTKLVDLSSIAELTINNYEADTDAITIYPSAEVNMDALKSAITLTESGTAVDVSVSKVDTVSGYNTSTQSTAPAYKIIKAGGFECDKIYNLTIGELLSSDLTAKLSDGYNKTFKLEEILIDDFSGDTSKWTLAQSNPSSQYHGNNTLNIKDGKLQLLTGATNSYQHALLPADYENMFALEDYTVEFDFTTVNQGSDYNFIRFGLTTNALPDISNANLPRFHVQNNGVRAFLTGDGNFVFTNDSSSTANYKFVAKDNRYVLYVNDKKMYDYETNGLDAVGAFGVMAYGNNAEYHFDNFKITKLTDLTNIAELTINSFEADTDAITIYPSAEVSTDALKSAITLTESGTAVDVSVSKVATISGYKTSTQSTAPAYKITKTGGFTCNKIYNLTINGLLSADSSAMMKDAYNKTFEIEEILIDDFSEDTSKWTLVQSNPSSAYHGNNEISIVDGKLKLFTGTSNYNNHVLVPADYENMLSLEDYTVEFDCTAVNSGDYFIKFGLTTKTMPEIDNNSEPRFHVQKGLIREYLKGNGSDWSFTQDSSIAIGEVVNYKFVAKDNRYVLYVNDKKMYDYTTTDNLAAVGVFGIAPLSANAEYHFDNFKITKTTEFANEIMISDVKINNGMITDVEGQETVDVKVVVQNTYADSKPCEVVIAVYDSTNENMKNAQTFDVKTLENGENTFTAEDFAVNGADMMKVFVFDGFSTLEPYCAPTVIE